MHDRNSTNKKKNKQKQKKAFGYMFETAIITTMHGLMNYRFPTAVREIYKGLLR